MSDMSIKKEERPIPRWQWRNGPRGTVAMDRWGSGDWVTYDDHRKFIGALEQQLRETDATRHAELTHHAALEAAYRQRIAELEAK